MSIFPEGYIEVKYQQVVRLRGNDGMIPFVLLEDKKERTIAVPLKWPEGELIQGALDGNVSLSQPYLTLLNCLEKVGIELKAVYIPHSKEFDLPAYLILQQENGDKIEVDIPCVEGIVCAQLSEAPIYIAEELMLAISATTSASERRV